MSKASKYNRFSVLGSLNETVHGFVLKNEAELYTTLLTKHEAKLCKHTSSTESARQTARALLTKCEAKLYTTLVGGTGPRFV